MLFPRSYNKSKSTIKLRNNILIFLFVVVLAYSLHQGTAKKGVEESTPAASSANSDIETYHEKKFTVIYVVDGDTLDIDLPDGKFDHTRVRLLGVDTPETKHPFKPVMYFGNEATQFTARRALGKEVQIILDPSGNIRDKYKRLLAYVILESGVNLNLELIVSGHGYADTRYQHSLYSDFIEAQQEAIENKAGLWEKVSSDQLPDWMQHDPPEHLKTAN